MALTQRTSDIIEVKKDINMDGWPVLELEFRYVRNRLVIDDAESARKMIELLHEIIDVKSYGEKQENKLPNFNKIKTNDKIL